MTSDDKMIHFFVWCAIKEKTVLTGLLWILFVQRSSLICVADAEVGQEVDEERSVEVLAQLVQDKPVEISLQ